jgi:hypothetical protein
MINPASKMTFLSLNLSPFFNGSWRRCLVFALGREMAKDVIINVGGPKLAEAKAG